MAVGRDPKYAAAGAEADGGAPVYDLPAPDSTSQAFWDAATGRRFLVKRCEDCGRAHFYPRTFCPFCWSEAVRWEDACGAATVYTYSVVRRNDLPRFAGRVPYVAAVVELAEGPRVMTNLVGVDPDDVRIGMAVVVDFAPAGDEGTALVPVFRPITG